MKNDIIRTEKLSKGYKNGVKAINSVSLSVTEGSRFVLLGPNGAGKSTLVRILSSLSRPDSGSCSVCGLNPFGESSKLMRKIGVATQENDLDPEMSGRKLLSFQGRLFGMDKTEMEDRVEELITVFSFTAHADKRVRELSGGNKRKLHCALALIHRPHLLFLDEPTVGMDPEVRGQFWESLRKINREEGMTLFLTTQYLEEADRHAEEMALLLDGEIRFRGSVDQFKRLGPGDKSLSLEEGYLAYLKNREAFNAAD